jgi:DNA phosphorothioation-dependent restriction protein DptG
VFKGSDFSKIVAKVLCLPFNIICIPFIPIYIISVQSDSHNNILWKLYDINDNILSKITDIKQFIYEDICGWYYGNRWFL